MGDESRARRDALHRRSAAVLSGPDVRGLRRCAGRRGRVAGSARPGADVASRRAARRDRGEG